MQDVLVIIVLLGAITFLGYRAYKKITRKDDCGNGNCGC